jgi:hypothetical protein
MQNMIAWNSIVNNKIFHHLCWYNLLKKFETKFFFFHVSTQVVFPKMVKVTSINNGSNHNNIHMFILLQHNILELFLR